MFQQGDDLIVTPLIRPVKAGLLLKVLVRSGVGDLGASGQEVDVSSPLEEVVDNVYVTLVTGGVERSVTIRALEVDRDVSIVCKINCLNSLTDLLVRSRCLKLNDFDFVTQNVIDEVSTSA